MTAKTLKIDGLPVVDATKKTVLHITRRDVSGAREKAPDTCAAAQACVREFDKCTEARVHLSRVYLKMGKKWVRYATPGSLRSEIVAFDRGGRFTPGDHMLYPVRESQRMSYKRSGYKDHAKKSKARIRPYHSIEGVRASRPGHQMAA